MDLNTFAKSIVDQAIGDKPVKTKDAAAVRRGHARKSLLSPEKRKSIAKSAAEARWSKERPEGEYPSESPGLV